MKGTIVVLGSKSNAPLPDVAAPYVVTANNAVERGTLYRERHGSRLIAMVPSEEFRNREHLRASFIKSRPDEIVILSGTEDDRAYIHSLGLSDAEISIIGRKERNGLMAKALGWRVCRVMAERLWHRGAKHFFLTAVPDLFGKGERSWQTGSTGLDAIFYSLQRFPDADIVAAGIGLEEGGHFTGVGEFTSKTARADRTTMKHWQPRRRWNVSSTDDTMIDRGGMPRWKGKILGVKDNPVT